MVREKSAQNTNLFRVHGDEEHVAAASRILYCQDSLIMYNPHPQARRHRVAAVPLGMEHVYYSDASVLQTEARKIPPLPNNNYGYVDLNRQYFLWDKDLKGKTIDQLKVIDKNQLLPIIVNSIGYEPAKALLEKLLEKNEEMEMFTTWHEDYRNPDTYLYDIVGGHDEPRLAQFNREFLKFQIICQEHGFSLFTGQDSPADPMLGMSAEKGLITQKVVDGNGDVHLDGTLEVMIGLLRELGFFPNLKHIFCIEFPGTHPPLDRNKELMGLYKDLLDSLL